MKATSQRLWALVLTLAAVLTLITGCMSGGVEDEAQANQAQTPANQGDVYKRQSQSYGEEQKLDSRLKNLVTLGSSR